MDGCALLVGAPMQCRRITGRLAIVIPDTASADAVVGRLLATACIVLLRVSRRAA
jgi:hypothetical protein